MKGIDMAMNNFATASDRPVVFLTSSDRVTLGENSYATDPVDHGYILVRENAPDRQRFVSHAGLMHMLDRGLAVVKYGSLR
jgi:hypothetical protein